MYNPLPDYITIKESSINGLGLFATEDISANIVLEKFMFLVKKKRMDISELHLVVLEIILMTPIVVKY